MISWLIRGRSPFDEIGPDDVFDGRDIPSLEANFIYPAASAGVFMDAAIIREPLNLLARPQRNEFEAFLADQLLSANGQLELLDLPQLLAWLEAKVEGEPGYSWRAFTTHVRDATAEAITDGVRDGNVGGLTVLGNMSEDYVRRVLAWSMDRIVPPYVTGGTF